VDDCCDVIEFLSRRSDQRPGALGKLLHPVLADGCELNVTIRFMPGRLAAPPGPHHARRNGVGG
jgi:hypothetical protein